MTDINLKRVTENASVREADPLNTALAFLCVGIFPYTSDRHLIRKCLQQLHDDNEKSAQALVDLKRDIRAVFDRGTTVKDDPTHGVVTLEITVSRLLLGTIKLEPEGVGLDGDT